MNFDRSEKFATVVQSSYHVFLIDEILCGQGFAKNPVYSGCFLGRMAESGGFHMFCHANDPENISMLKIL